LFTVAKRSFLQPSFSLENASKSGKHPSFNLKVGAFCGRAVTGLKALLNTQLVQNCEKASPKLRRAVHF
jgi:hypothetical protein